MLAQHLGTQFVHVPYRSGAQMLQAIHTGEAQFGIAALASANAMVRDGLARGVAVTGTERFPTYPEIPTLAESSASPASSSRCSTYWWARPAWPSGPPER